MRRRRERGNSSVEFLLIIPVVLVLIAAIAFFRRGYLTDLETLHTAETETWEAAMTNDHDGCSGAGGRHALSRVNLGGYGNQARELAAGSMRSFSFLFENGYVRRTEVRAVPAPLAPLHLDRWTTITRADYLPCNEVIGSDDGRLPGAFDALAAYWVSP